MADWGKLPHDIATSIAEHLLFLEDFEAFAFVCSSWRIAAKRAKFRANVSSPSPSPSSSTKSPWLMLTEHDDASNQRRFYCHHNHKVRTANLPPSLNPNNTNIRLLSSLGWLLCNRGNNPCLVNPFSGAMINLPKVSYKYFLNGTWDYYYFDDILIEKFVLSENPSSSTEFTIALVLAEPYADLGSRHENISFWRSGDDEWETLLDHQHHIWALDFCTDITFYNGSFYSVDYEGLICRYDFEGCPHELVVVKLRHQLPDDSRNNRTHTDDTVVYYLVELDNQLLVVCRIRARMKVHNNHNYSRARIEPKFETVSFKVYELNVDNGKLKSVPNLGNAAIFVGSNSSFSTKASFGDGIKPNCIYFSDDQRKSSYYILNCSSETKASEKGIFSLADENIHQLDCVEPPYFSKHAPYMWLEDPTL